MAAEKNNTTGGDPTFNEPVDMKFSMKKHFDTMADHYDAGFGTVWRNVADQMLALNPVPIISDSVIHDNGCGTGQVTERIVSKMKLSGKVQGWPKIFATDFSEKMIEELRKGQVLGPDIHYIESTVMDSENLDFPDEFFTHSFASIVLMVVPDPDAMAKEIL